MKVLVVDDEAIARQRVMRLTRQFSEATEIREASNGFEALQILSGFNPDIVFLDIQMPEMTGFDILQNLEAREFTLIFQTAYDEFALQAFEENACDYLLKPFSPDRFQKALEKAIISVKAKQSLQRLEESLLKEKHFLTKVISKSSSKTRIIPLEEIICFVSRDHLTSAICLNGEHIIDLSLQHLAKRLNPELFIRCHRNCIIAVQHLKGFNARKNEAELSNQMTAAVSRSSRKALFELLKSASVPCPGSDFQI